MSCLFCAIVAGQVPSRRIHEDDTAVAFLDIAPWHRGHSLVVPKAHRDDVRDGDGALTEIAPAVDATTRLLTSRLPEASGLTVLSSAGADAGQEIFHLHVHLIPRYPERAGLAGLANRDPHAGDDLDGLHRLLTA